MTTATVKNPNSEATQRVFDLMLTFVKSQCMYVSTRLGIFNLLSEKGEQSAEALAKQTNTDPD